MKNSILILALFFCSTLSFFGQVTSTQKTIEDIAITSKKIVNHNWFVTKSDSSVIISYCKSCNVFASMDSSGNFIDRFKLFKEKGPDSVAIYSTVSYPINGFTNLIDKLNWYKPDDVAKIEIVVKPKWTKQKLDTTLQNNIKIKDTLLNKFYKLCYSNYEDFKYHNPTRSYQGYKFKSLPYTSSKYNCSIFIHQPLPIDCFSITATDSSSNYMHKTENFLDDDIKALLNSLAFSLDLTDFQAH